MFLNSIIKAMEEINDSEASTDESEHNIYNQIAVFNLEEYQQPQVQKITSKEDIDITCEKFKINFIEIYISQIDMILKLFINNAGQIVNEFEEKFIDEEQINDIYSHVKNLLIDIFPYCTKNFDILKFAEQFSHNNFVYKINIFKNRSKLFINQCKIMNEIDILYLERLLYYLIIPDLLDSKDYNNLFNGNSFVINDSPNMVFINELNTLLIETRSNHKKNLYCLTKSIRDKINFKLLINGGCMYDKIYDLKYLKKNDLRYAIRNIFIKLLDPKTFIMLYGSIDIPIINQEIVDININNTQLILTYNELSLLDDIINFNITNSIFSYKIIESKSSNIVLKYVLYIVLIIFISTFIILFIYIINR